MVQSTRKINEKSCKVSIKEASEKQMWLYSRIFFYHLKIRSWMNFIVFKFYDSAFINIYLLN